MAIQAVQRATSSVHCTAFQHVTLYRVLPNQVQTRGGHPSTEKGSCDDSQLKNYRPVSNLPSPSKLLEKVVQNQLQHHLISNDVMPKFQSAYRQSYSTETAVNKILNDLLLAADQGHVSALSLLDLTAAFDTVDHSLLLTTTATVFRCRRLLSGVVFVLPIRQKLLRGRGRCFL